jgi:hypothetical protein
MAVETTVADSSETVVICDPIEGNNSNSNSCSSDQASPDSSCIVMDEQIQTIHDQQEIEMPLRRQNSVIRLIRPELLMKEEHVLSATDLSTSAPRIDVIVNPHQFQPEFRPMMMQQSRRSIKRFPQLNGGNNNASAVVSSSTSPGPSRRTSPPPPPQQPVQQRSHNTVMGPPPPPALLSSPLAAIPKNGSQNSSSSTPVAKSTPSTNGGRIRKSTAGAHRRQLASQLDHAEEPSSSIPEIGKYYYECTTI